MCIRDSPDFGQDEARLERTVQNACMAKADLLFVGGSLLTSAAFNRCVELVKQWSDRPVVLFPGSPAQLSKHADAVLLLSLISGRNPELLIGHHVTAAPTLKAMGCLLYTSDAADERSSVDLGGRRIIKKKTTIKKQNN